MHLSEVTDMSDYAFVHNGKAFTPNQSTVAVEDVATHNAAIQQAELACWKTQPDSQLGYYSFPDEHNKPEGKYRTTFRPSLKGAIVTSWTGDVLGVITDASIYLHNFGSRMVALRITGSNGANYHGRASYDWGSCINLRKDK